MFGAGMGRWWWNYPAKEASGFFVFFGCMLIAFSLVRVLAYGQEPSYLTASGSMQVGLGCALLVYHVKKGGKEDTAAKKKIILVGMAAFMSMVALEVLSLLSTLNIL